MFLTDYYFNQANLRQEKDYLLAYSPLENENKIFIKLERSLEKGKSFYLKSGYMNNTFKFEDFSISGWLAIVGIEFSY
jgi:hypothetical protein